MILSFFGAIGSNAQEIIELSVSKPYCLFHFLEASSGSGPAVSPTLKQYVAPLQQDRDFQKICEDFRQVKLHYTISRDEYPSGRRNNRSTKDLIIIALVGSQSLPEFEKRAIGILPNTEYLKLTQSLRAAEPFYNRMIWTDNLEKLEFQKQKLGQMKSKATEVFKAARTFYRSSWTDQIPFIVSLYPIPGKRGSSSATPHANSLCVGVLTEETAHVERMGVVLHEICHVLYDEQPAAFQHEIQGWFDSSTSDYAPAAYSFFDEALATAIGNGWAYKKISGKMDDTDWYNNTYINGFAKALFPMTESYLNEGRAIDQSFVEKAIALFAERFPQSLTDYGILFNQCSVYTDIETNDDRGALLDTIETRFRLSSFSLSAPVLDPKSVEMLQTTPGTQVLVIDRNHQANWAALSGLFPELAALKQQDITHSALISFIDKQKRPIVLLFARKESEVKLLVDKMAELGSFDRNQAVQFLN